MKNILDFNSDEKHFRFSYHKWCNHMDPNRSLVGSWVFLTPIGNKGKNYFKRSNFTSIDEFMTLDRDDQISKLIEKE